MHVEFVCIANYCRSPVAEALLKEICTDIDVTSSGLNPYHLAKMDDRSIDYLKANGIDSVIHLPKKFKPKSRNTDDLIICFDLTALHLVWKQHPSQRDFLRIYNIHDNSIRINDPFKMKSEKDYYVEMDKVKKIVDIWSNQI